MQGGFHLELRSKSIGEGVRREVCLSQEGSSDKKKIFYEISGAAGAVDPPVLDGFALGVLLIAMMAGKALFVHGAMSRSALYNLDLLQSCWALWRPQRYRRIEIRPDRVVDLEAAKPGRPAISAFSGGADSTFTLLRHATKRGGMASHNLRAAVMVHGFDVHLSKPEHFSKLLELRAPLLRELKLDLRTIRTNVKEQGLQNWEDAHGLMVASCLHQFADEFEFGLIASGDPYHELLLPWGSNPITDHLYSGDRLTVVHDGAGNPKVEKIALISQFPAAMEGLHVCFENTEEYRNCGRCGKCINSRLAFMAVGKNNPPCFDAPLSLEQIKAIKVGTVRGYNRLRMLANYAEGHGVEGEWLRIVRRRLRAYERKGIARGLRAAFESRTISALNRLGLKEAVKRNLRATKPDG